MNIKKFIAFGCLHSPFTDMESFNWAIKNIQEYKPDYIINLGDLLESSAASKWNNEDTHSLEKEFNTANEILKTIREAGKSATCVFLPGNHEANLTAVGRLNPQIRSLCDWKKESNLPELKNWKVPCTYEFDKNRGVWRLGAISFAHGYMASMSSDDLQGLLLGRPFGLSIQAHTHRGLKVTQSMRTKTVPLPYWYANVGCLRNLDPEWCQRLNTFAWTQSLCRGEVLIDQGKTSSRARESVAWEAETLFYKTKTEYTKI